MFDALLIERGGIFGKSTAAFFIARFPRAREINFYGIAHCVRSINIKIIHLLIRATQMCVFIVNKENCARKVRNF